MNEVPAEPVRDFPHGDVSEIEARQIEKIEGVSRALLTAAKRAFEKWGYNKTGLTDIARGAGTSRANVYNYFPEGKEQILRELLKIKNSAFNQQFSRVMPMKGPTSEILKHRFIFGIEHIRQDDLLLELIDDTSAPQIRNYAVFSVIDDFWHDLCEHAEKRGELRSAAKVEDSFRWIFIVFNSMLRDNQRGKLISIDDVGGLLDEFFMPGLFD